MVACDGVSRKDRSDGGTAEWNGRAHARAGCDADGETMPWHNDAFDAMLPKGFTKDRVGNMKKGIGGG